MTKPWQCIRCGAYKHEPAKPDEGQPGTVSPHQRKTSRRRARRPDMTEGIDTRRGPRAIETAYKGYRFRSRLEARWAVFLDYLGVKYEYEPEGYSLDGLNYLPDFWLPAQNCWVEIKGAEIGSDSDEWEKCRRLAVATGKRVYLFYGQIGAPIGDWRDSDDASAYVFFPLGDPEWLVTLDVDHPHDDPDDHDRWWFANWWCECPRCGFAGIAFSGQAWKLACGHDRRLETFASARLMRAYDRARSARFEFGEHG